MREFTRWCLVVPVKRLSVAKSRLTGLSPTHRSALALAFAADTVTAALAAPGVTEVVTVTDDPDAAALLAQIGARVVTDEPDAGLNPALAHGARAAAAHHPGAGIGALSADLPALRSVELARALGLASGGAAVVADAGGSGTTAYLVPHGALFRPAFGTGSLRAHVNAGAKALDGGDLDSLRRDVDTPADLAEALRLGVGPHTAAALARMARPAPAHRRPAGPR